MTSSSDARGTATVKLDCSHYMTYGPPPAAGDIVWCAQCRRYSRVAGKPAGPAYKSICRVCQFSRNSRNLRMAELFADTHRLKWRHAVDVRTTSGKIIATVLPIVTKS